MRRLILIALLSGIVIISFIRFISRNETVNTVPSRVENAKISEWTSFLNENFASDFACRECHQAEYDAHLRSGHSHTALRMEDTHLATALSGTTYSDPRRQQVFEFLKKELGFFVGVEGVDSTPIFPVHWLLGSGTHAQTPISIDPISGHGVEFRWSWFNGGQCLGVTPDHERFDDFRERSTEVFGRPMEPAQALTCLGCHATVVPPLNIPVTKETVLANVGCERCHGPRKRHVELAKLGKGHLEPPLVTYTDPEQSIRQCAQCHRDESNIGATTAPNILARFQPYGMKKSRCYLESGKSMTCITCHDPHDATSKDRFQYNNTCMKCHQAPETTLCRIEPAGDCVKCHMPEVEWHSGIKFHDHWIRVVKEPTSTVQTSLVEPSKQ